MPDFHKILNLSKTASLIDLRNAYRSMAMKFHPDVNKSKEANAAFREITEAYNALYKEKKNASSGQKKYQVFNGHVVEQHEFDVRIQNEWHKKYNLKHTMITTVTQTGTDLNELGSNQSDLVLNRILKTLETYKKTQNNVHVESDFIIPYQDMRFLPDVWGLKLGLVVQNIRLHEYLSEHKEKFVKLGLSYVYTGNDITEALRIYRDEHKNLNIPRNYMVPFNNNKYPKQLWGLKLGKVVRNIRTRNAYSEYRDVVEALGLRCTNENGNSNDTHMVEVD